MYITHGKKNTFGDLNPALSFAQILQAFGG